LVGVCELVRCHLDVYGIDSIWRRLRSNCCTIESGDGSFVKTVSPVDLAGVKGIKARTGEKGAGLIYHRDTLRESASRPRP
jgi:hypothetical protein